LTLNNGVELPRIGLGTFKSAGPEVGTSVKAALHQGIRHIDTASIYKNQELIATALKESGLLRSEVFITSKVSPYEQGREKARKACIDILTKLDTDYVDLVLVHWPGASKTPPDSHLNSQLRTETWQVLEEFYRQGKFRAIGVSNYEERHLHELLSRAQVPPAVNQVEVHPRRTCRALRAACSRAGIAVVAYASLGCGQLLGQPTVTCIASELGVSPAQVLLRWGLQEGCAVIPKSVSPQRIQQFSEAALLGGGWELSARHMADLGKLDDGHKYCWDASGIL